MLDIVDPNVSSISSDMQLRFDQRSSWIADAFAKFVSPITFIRSFLSRSYIPRILNMSSMCPFDLTKQIAVLVVKLLAFDDCCEREREREREREK